MWKLFKKKEEVKDNRKEIILTEYITELRRLGFTDEQIVKKFQEKNYPKEFIDYLLQLKQEVKQMPKEDTELEEESEDDEEVSDEELEDEEEVVVKPKKVEKKVVEEAKVTLDEVLQSLNQRISNIEASIYRLRSI
jgi:hypothetical protein